MASAGQTLTDVLTFSAAGRNMAIPADLVVEVVATPSVTQIPQAPAALKGLVNHRGAALPLVSVGVALGEKAGERERRVIVLQATDAVALAVDAVSAVQSGVIQDRATIAIGDETLALVDLDALLKSAFTDHARRRAEGRDELPPSKLEAGASAVVSFLAFAVADQVYALPLDQVSGVVVPPRGATHVASEDPAIPGVMRYRDGALPLVSLRALLGLAPEAGERVVVTKVANVPVGLVVDRVTAILRVTEGQVGAAPAIVNRGRDEARVASIIRTDDGLVGVLSQDLLFDGDMRARLSAKARADESLLAAGGDVEQIMQTFVLFRVGDETYGLPTGSVREIVRRPEAVTPAPHAPAFIAGLTSHRGQPLPLVDPRVRFGVASSVAGHAERIVIADVGDALLGFIVEGVEQIATLPADAVSAAPILATTKSAVFARIGELDSGVRPVLLIDPDALIDEVARDLQKAVSRGSDAPE